MGKIKELIRGSMPQVDEPPSDIQPLRRRLFLGGLAWIGFGLAGALLFEDTPVMIVVTVILVLGWLALVFFSIRYMRHVFSDKR